MMPSSRIKDQQLPRTTTNTNTSASGSNASNNSPKTKQTTTKLILATVIVITVFSTLLSHFILDANNSIQLINNIYNDDDLINLLDLDEEEEDANTNVNESRGIATTNQQSNIIRKKKTNQDASFVSIFKSAITSKGTTFTPGMTRTEQEDKEELSKLLGSQGDGGHNHELNEGYGYLGDDDGKDYYSRSSSSSSSTDSPISYKVIHNLPFKNIFDPFYKCDPSKRRSAAPIFKQNNIFNFHVQISTSLNILYMGDSVGIQFSQGLQEATGATYEQRKVLRYSWRDHEGLHIAAPVRGGGSVAGWRITGMLQKKQINNYWQMPQTPGGGWMEVDLRNVRRALAIMSPSKLSSSFENDNNQNHPKESCMKSLNSIRKITKVESYTMNQTAIEECPERNFDVLIHQFPFGWFEKPALDLISYERIHESVMTSNEYYGANIIILQTVPVGNNLIDFHSEIIPINKMIWNYTNTFQYDDDSNDEAESDRPIKAVLVMDMAALSMELFKHNAHALGLINITLGEDGEEDEEEVINQLNSLLDYRTDCCHYLYRQIIGFTCAVAVANFTKNCVHTKYSNDGHHFCLNEIGGRVHGASACLIKCGTDFTSSTELRRCEKRCNDQYMSLKPIPFQGKNDELENY